MPGFPVKQRMDLYRLKHQYEDEPEDPDEPYFEILEHAKYLERDVPRTMRNVRDDIESGDYDAAMSLLNSVSMSATNLMDKIGTIRRCRARSHPRRKQMRARKSILIPVSEMAKITKRTKKAAGW